MTTDQAVRVALTVNRTRVERLVEPRQSLVDFLRHDLELTGSHVGCEQGVCGACTVRMDGALVRACLMLAVQADGSRVETIEGVSASGEIADLQHALAEENGLHADSARRACCSPPTSCCGGTPGPTRTGYGWACRGITAGAPGIRPS